MLGKSLVERGILRVRRTVRGAPMFAWEFGDSAFRYDRTVNCTVRTILDPYVNRIHVIQIIHVHRSFSIGFCQHGLTVMSYI